jgi:spermidine/putrescine transport system permease protein
MAATAEVGTRPPRVSRRAFRSGSLTALLVLPASLWYLVLLVAPLLIVVVMSFGHKSRLGGYDPAFTFDNYADALDPNRISPFVTSLALAVSGTVLCLLAALPIAYFIATRGGRRKSLLIVLLIVPFWTSFLIRTYAWLTILGPDGLGGFIGRVIGDDSFRILGTPAAVLLGVVYGYLPLMVFPIYVTMERMDRTLIEASKDLGAGRWATFRQITLPITATGLITGSILVFIPLMGEYVVPAILGYGRVFLVGNQLVLQFLESRNWPEGSARAVVLILIMLVSVVFYLWFVNRGRRTREVSVL